jgi:hypothetical protein
LGTLAFADGASLASSVARAAIAAKPSASLQLVKKLLEQAAQAKFELRAIIQCELDRIVPGVNAHVGKKKAE